MIMTGIHIDKEKKKWMFFCIWDLSGIGYPFASKYGGNGQYENIFPCSTVYCLWTDMRKIILDFLEKGYSKKELASIVIVGTLFLVSAYVTKKIKSVDLLVFIVAAHDVDFQDIIKWSLWVHLGAVLFVIGSCYGGDTGEQGSMYKKAANESGTA